MDKKTIILVSIVGVIFLVAVVGSSYVNQQRLKCDYGYIKYGFFGNLRVYCVSTLQELSDLYDEYGLKYNYFIMGKYTDKSCNFEGRVTGCGTKFYCPTHMPEAQCLSYNGTWEFESPENNYNFPDYAITRGGEE